MNNNKLNRKFNFNDEPTVLSTQYISTGELESQENKNLNDKGLSFLHTNIKSLIKNKSLLEELIIFPDILGICETKLSNKSNIDLISLENYNLHFVNSKTKSSGVLI